MNKMETAKYLAEAHQEVDSCVEKVFLLKPYDEDNPDEPIKLLEVVEGAFEVGIRPIGFTPDPENDINFPSLIVEVSPEEYQDILDKNLNFGDRGWKIGKDLLAAV